MAHVGLLLIGVFIAGVSCGTGFAALLVFLSAQAQPERQVELPPDYSHLRPRRLVLLKR
jgi:hypothetical protein